jgi:hypothetical protein
MQQPGRGPPAAQGAGQSALAAFTRWRRFASFRFSVPPNVAQ